MVVVVFVVGLNFKQVMVISCLLLSSMFAQNVQFTAVVVDTFLTGWCSFKQSNGVVGGADVVKGGVGRCAVRCGSFDHIYSSHCL